MWIFTYKYICFDTTREYMCLDIAREHVCFGITRIRFFMCICTFAYVYVCIILFACSIPVYVVKCTCGSGYVYPMLHRKCELYPIVLHCLFMVLEHFNRLTCWDFVLYWLQILYDFYHNYWELSDVISSLLWYWILLYILYFIPWTGEL